MPRNRAARAAVLGSAVQRSAATPYPSRASNALRRRLILGVLIVLSLAMITFSFREPTSGAVHRMQGAGAAVLHPFQIAAVRVAQPFRDTYGYFHGLFTAKSQNERLRRQVELLRARMIANQTKASDAAQLKSLLGFKDSPSFPEDYRLVATRVISVAASPFDQRVAIAAGSNEGVRQHAPVVASQGTTVALVGLVTNVFPTSAQVTLLTDPDSAVSALDSSSAGVRGMVMHGQGNALILNHVAKDQIVERDDVIVTAGTHSPTLRDLYPRGLPIGTVSSVGQTDVDLYKQIQVTPFADFTSLDTVGVLVSKKPLPEGP